MRIFQPAKLVLISISLVFLASCNFLNSTGEGGSLADAYYNLPLIANIVEVKIEPNPVVAGDSISFTGVIKDKKVTNIDFQWSIEPFHVERPIITTDNFLKIKSPDQTGIYKAELIIWNPNVTGVRPDNYKFEYEVIE